MIIRETIIPNCYEFENTIYEDNRGEFGELYRLGNSEIFFDPKQINYSISKKNVVRGLHIATFTKLVTCVSGWIWDVVVDFRPNSPTFKKWLCFDLYNGTKQVLVPAGCGHGFFAYFDSVVVYSQTGCYNPAIETSVFWRDPEIDIEWPEAKEYILSDKDTNAPLLTVPK